jgi:hypothetical protein
MLVYYENHELETFYLELRITAYNQFRSASALADSTNALISTRRAPASGSINFCCLFYACYYKTESY